MNHSMIRKSTTVLILFGLLAAVSIFVLFQNQGTTNNKTKAVLLVIAPQSVTMKQGDTEQVVNSDQNIHLPHGTYSIVFSKDNFLTLTKEVTITADSPERLLIFLEPENSAAQLELREEVNQIALQGIADLEHLQDEQFYELNPITTKLPINNPLTKISYEIDPSDKSGNSIVLIIDAWPGYRHAAISRIQNAGFDPTQFNIKFLNYTNPFSL